MTTFSAAFRAWLTEQLEARGVSQSAITTRLGTSASTLNGFMTGKRGLTFEMADKVFGVLPELSAQDALEATVGVVLAPSARILGGADADPAGVLDEPHTTQLRTIAREAQEVSIRHMRIAESLEREVGSARPRKAHHARPHRKARG